MNLNLILVNFILLFFFVYLNKQNKISILGDLIDVHAKQEDGWWLGALKNKVGIFPATYVEEIA